MSWIDLRGELIASIHSAISALPTAEEDDASSIIPPKDGISILSIKNELLLSYLQHLVWLIMHRERNGNHAKSRHEPVQEQKSPEDVNGEDFNAECGEARGGSDHQSADEDAIRKLVELRVYLERGVRPLEGRLKYQLDKVIRAAEDATAREKIATKDVNGAPMANGNVSRKKNKGGKTETVDSNESTSDSEVDSEVSTSGGENESEAGVQEGIDALSYRPNPAAFARPAAPARPSKLISSKDVNASGVYQPPRINPVAPPSAMTGPRSTDKRDREPRSRILDTYLESEFSNAPVATPSIGTTIAAGGRRERSAKERREEAERERYEEAHFVRLPKENKEKRKGRNDGRGGGWGGEDWAELGRAGDRIARATRKEGGGGVGGALERSRKRKGEGSEADVGGRGEGNGRQGHY
ncbi:hypothetical protein BDY21DRAFT_421466 [Lineolata rhizophorae]|uniref:Sas10/Utp3/C1D family-domain-containing protein n=1 Tax=Lineolata rhizophorae TaxID=578093 RepID=A0A6A6P0S8_9PEZI|nr:hypothetical protein BDY21DRAFT_421466 [Lineolata rhizophorae]